MSEVISREAVEAAHAAWLGPNPTVLGDPLDMRDEMSRALRAAAPHLLRDERERRQERLRQAETERNETEQTLLTERKEHVRRVNGLRNQIDGLRNQIEGLEAEVRKLRANHP